MLNVYLKKLNIMIQWSDKSYSTSQKVRKSALGTCQSGSYCDKWNKDGSADCKRHCPPVSLSQRSSSSSKSSLPVPIFVIIISSICSSSFSITLPRFLAKPLLMSCQERSHAQHNCHPSGGVFQLCPQGMINLVWFSRPGNCVFLFFFLVLLNDPSKSFHHPCFYYNLWKGNGLGFIHLGYLYPSLKKSNSDIFTQFLLFCIVENPSKTCIKINVQQKIPSEREVQHHARNCLHCLQCLHCFYRSLCVHCFNKIGAKRLFGLDTP